LRIGFEPGPGLLQIDLAPQKRFAIDGTRNFEFRWEAFNAFNRPNLGNPATSISSSSAFGRITGPLNTTTGGAEYLLAHSVFTRLHPADHFPRLLYITHSTNVEGTSSRAMSTWPTRSRRMSDSAAARAASIVGYDVHTSSKSDATPRLTLAISLKCSVADCAFSSSLMPIGPHRLLPDAGSRRPLGLSAQA
jgi:hypothetical protein